MTKSWYLWHPESIQIAADDLSHLSWKLKVTVQFSVTRVWRKFKSLWHFCEWLFSIWQKLEPTLAYAIWVFRIAVNGQKLNKKSNQMVTLNYIIFLILRSRLFPETEPYCKSTLDLGLFTSCCSHQTACWRPACCWQRMGNVAEGKLNGNRAWVLSVGRWPQ